MVKGDPTLINDLKVSSRKMSNWTLKGVCPVILSVPLHRSEADQTLAFTHILFENTDLTS